MKINKKFCYISGAFLFAFLLLSVLLKFVDVAQANNSDVIIGFSTINNALYFEYNEFFYQVTQWLGYYAIMICVFFAGVGVVQWIQRKSLKKVDRNIYFLAALYVLTMLVYVLFLFVTINTRPNILPNEINPESSFPSSHTILSICVFSSALIMAHNYFAESKFALVYSDCFCGLLIFVSIIGRLLSGAHWFTDILGSILMSGFLIFLFLTFVKADIKKENN